MKNIEIREAGYGIYTLCSSAWDMVTRYRV